MESPIAKAGWMHRQSAVLRRWKPQWFVLYSSGELCYFESQDSHRPEDRLVVCAVCIGIKTGRQLDISPPEGRGVECLIQLDLRSGDHLKMCAESADDMKAWQVALEQARVQNQSAASGQVPPGYPAAPMAYPPAPQSYPQVPGAYPLSTTQVVYPQNVGYPGYVVAGPGQYVVPNAAVGSGSVVMSQVPNQVVCVRDPYYRRRGFGYPYGFYGPLWW